MTYAHMDKDRAATLPQAMLQSQLLNSGYKPMSTNTLIVLLILFCIVMVGIIVVILTREVNASKRNEQRITDLQEILKKQYTHRVESIDVIARAMVDKQCELIEGCIRLKQLLDCVEADLLRRDEYKVISLIYSETEHMPIKEQWKQLDKKAKQKFTQHRLALEAKHSEEIHVAVSALQQHEFLAYQSLN